MKLSNHWPPTRKTLITTLAAVILILGMALAILAFQAAQQYDQRLAQLKSQLTDQITQTESILSEQINDQEALPDRTLERLQAQIDQSLQDIPEQPRLAWLSLHSENKTNHQRDLATALRNSRDRLNEASQIGAYQRQAGQILAKLSQGQGRNLEQQKALVITWQQAHDSLENQIAPSTLQNQHQHILTQLKGVTQKLSKLAELYEQKQQADFNSLEQDLTKDFIKFADISQEYTNIIIEKDTQLNQALVELSQLLTTSN